MQSRMVTQLREYLDEESQLGSKIRAYHCSCMRANEKCLGLARVVVEVSDNAGQSPSDTLMKLPEPLSLGWRNVHRNITMVKVSKMRVQDFKTRWGRVLEVRPSKVLATRHQHVIRSALASSKAAEQFECFTYPIPRSILILPPPMPSLNNRSVVGFSVCKHR